MMKKEQLKSTLGTVKFKQPFHNLLKPYSKQFLEGAR